MNFKFIAIPIVIFLNSPIVHSEYISLLSGYQYSKHSYLPDDATLSSTIYGAKLDLSDWRLKEQGLFSRGLKLSYKQGINFQQLEAQVPVYHWHKHQGIWLQVSQQTKNMKVVVLEDKVFLNNQNSSIALGAGSKILAEHSINQYGLFWHEAIQYKAPLNLIGIFYHSEASPAASNIFTNSADIFDGLFTGFGLSVGRISDERGANFQWKLNLAQLDLSFSDNATQHRAASKKESRAQLIDLEINWHYRYYLAPYWYLVPQIKVGFSTIFQTEENPESIEFKALNQLNTSSLISLQRRF